MTCFATKLGHRSKFMCALTKTNTKTKFTIQKADSLFIRKRETERAAAAEDSSSGKREDDNSSSLLYLRQGTLHHSHTYFHCYYHIYDCDCDGFLFLINKTLEFLLFGGVWLWKIFRFGNKGGFFCSCSKNPSCSNFSKSINFVHASSPFIVDFHYLLIAPPIKFSKYMEASGWKVNSQGWVDMFNHTKKKKRGKFGKERERERERERDMGLGMWRRRKEKGFFTFTKKKWGKKSVKPVLCSCCGSN